MTYSTGGLIQASDYNGFVTNTNTTWNASYGQTSLASVSAGTLINASSWATLNTTVANLATHQGTSITSRTSPVVGQKIAILANLGTDITSVNTNRFNAALQGSQYTAWTGTSSKTSPTGSGGAPWTITFTHTVTWPSDAAKNYFFNAGGQIKIQFSKTSTGTSQDTEWNTFIPKLGTIYLSSTGASKTIVGVPYTGTTKIGGSGTPAILATATGAAQLTGSPTILFKQFDSGTYYIYSTSYVEVAASYSGSTMTFVTTWRENGDVYGANISGGTPTTGIVFGTAPATVITYLPPETTYLTNTWGTPTISASVV
jgi:hypothetical protein